MPDTLPDATGPNATGPHSAGSGAAAPAPLAVAVPSAASAQVPGLAIGLLASLALFWGVNWPAMKLAVGTVEPWTFRTVCLLTGALGLLTIAWAGGQNLRVPRANRRPLVLAALLNVTGWHLCSAYGLTFIDAGRAAIVAFTMPLWAAILSVAVLGERLTAVRIAGLVLGLAGLAVLVLPAVDVIGASLWGPLFMLGAAVSWASGTVTLKAVRWQMPVIQLAGWQLLLGSIPVCLGTALIGRPETLLNLDWRSGLGLAFAATIPMVYCHYAWFKTVSLVPANVAAIGTLAIPVVGVLSSGLVLGEPIGASELIALGLVVGGLALVLLRLPRRLARSCSRSC